MKQASLFSYKLVYTLCVRRGTELTDIEQTERKILGDLYSDGRTFNDLQFVETMKREGVFSYLIGASRLFIYI